MDNVNFSYLEDENASGVVIGKTEEGKILLSSGPENVLVLGSSRCGKGINTVIPTALTWKESAFFLDYKGETFEVTAEYRQEKLGQKIIRINPLFYDGIHQCKEDFDAIIHDLLDPEQKVSCYLVIPIKEAKAAKPIAKFFVSSLISALLKRTSEQKLLLMLDEICQLGEMPGLPLLAAASASCGAKICMVSQNLKQVYRVYKRESSIYPSLQVICAFFSSDFVNDEELASFLSDILGERDILIYEGTKKYHIETVKNFTTEEMQLMPKDSIIVQTIGTRPLRLKRFQFYSEPYFADKMAAPYGFAGK